MTVSPDACAQEILEVVPQVMRAIRAEMRRHRAADLSVPQFRTLSFIDRNPGTALSDAAEYIGLTLPSMSKLVDGLVTRKLVTRQTRLEDRRCMTLALTPRGQAALQASRAATRACLAEDLSASTERERQTIAQAMQLLKPLFMVPSESNVRATR